MKSKNYIFMFSKHTGLFFIIVYFALTNISIADAETYYVDKNSLGGTCNNAGPGTITSPWCSWSKKFWDGMKQLLPGDTVYIRGGTYNERFHFNSASQFSGTAANPIHVRAYPGEKVIFDGTTSGGNGLYIPGNNSYINIHGPIEIQNFSACMESSGTLTKYGWVIDGIDAHNCKRGLLIRNFDGISILNSRVHDTNGDGEAGGVFMSNSSTNIYISNVTSYHHNDGRGVTGDADGFWADQTVGTVVMKNVVAYGNSEEGFDIKATNATIENGVAYDNSTCGFKFWNGHFKVTNFIAYNNGEDGLKCSQADMDFSHVVSVGNRESGLQFRTVGCTGTIRNSIFANNHLSAIEFSKLSLGETINVTLRNNIYQHSSPQVIVNGCGSNSTTYSNTDIESGVFDSKLKAGISCGTGYGSMSGSDANSISKDPMFTNIPPVAASSSISYGPTGLNYVVQNAAAPTPYAEYPWPGYTVGSLIELDNDGVLRELTQVDSVTKTIYFEKDPLTQAYRGRATDGSGVRIVDWGTSVKFDTSENFKLKTGSPAIGKGVFVSGLHCATADNDPTNPMNPRAACIHWNGTAPDIGLTKGYAGKVIPPAPPRNIK